MISLLRQHQVVAVTSCWWWSMWEFIILHIINFVCSEKYRHTACSVARIFLIVVCNIEASLRPFVSWRISFSVGNKVWIWEHNHTIVCWVIVCYFLNDDWRTYLVNTSKAYCSLPSIPEPIIHSRKHRNAHILSVMWLMSLRYYCPEVGADYFCTKLPTTTYLASKI